MGASVRVGLFASALACAVAACGSADEGGLTADDDEIVKADLPTRAEVKVLLTNGAFDPATVGATSRKRTVTFYDTPSLALSKSGLFLRARTSYGDDDDLTVKLRPLAPSKVLRSLQDEEELECELDVNVGKPGTSSCSWKERADGARVSAAARDARKISTLWSDRAQRFAAQAGHEVATLELRAYGPIASTVWKLESPELDEEITFERWEVPGGDTTIEASIKVKIANVVKKQAALLDWLAARGLSQATVQKTKTAAALEALSKQTR